MQNILSYEIISEVYQAKPITKLRLNITKLRCCNELNVLIVKYTCFNCLMYLFSISDIYEKVTKGIKPFLRPTIEEFDCPNDELAALIRRCWSEDPNERPDFQTLKSLIRKLNRSVWSHVRLSWYLIFPVHFDVTLICMSVCFQWYLSDNKSPLLMNRSNSNLVER